MLPWVRLEWTADSTLWQNIPSSPFGSVEAALGAELSGAIVEAIQASLPPRPLGDLAATLAISKDGSTLASKIAACGRIRRKERRGLLGNLRS
jgi:hypothetical protein